jgi:hypothetical protein
VRLEAVQIGKVLWTSREAVARFISALTAAREQSIGASVAQDARAKQADRELAELEALGV